MTTHAFSPTFDLGNPFAPRAAFAEEDDVAEAREPSFALVQSGPPVPSEEVESPHLDAVEVTVRWGAQILSVTHLAKGKSFAFGAGADRAPVVVARGDGAYVVVPKNARGTLIAPHLAAPASIAELLARGALEASGELEGASEIALGAGMKVHLEIGDANVDPLTFEISTVRAGRVVPIGFLAALATGATGFVGLSFLGHAAIVASLAMFTPAMAHDDAEGIDRDQLMLMQKLLNASAEREQEPPKETAGASEDAAGGGSTGQPHMGESGAAGTTRPVTTNGHMAFRGSDNHSTVSRRDELTQAATEGMIGLLANANLRDPNAPSSPWSTDTYHGADERSAIGKMFGASIDDAVGSGLGFFGTGGGGGGKGEGIGVDRVGTIGGGGGGPGKWGIGKGDKDGMGNGHGLGRPDHVAKAPNIRPQTFASNGRLPAEVIQRIVHLNFGRFRLCYEGGLRQNPALTGRVSTRFTIGRDGAVGTAQDAGSDLPDQSVVQCVVRSFNALSFPMPEGGIATVTYPILLTPGG